MVSKSSAGRRQATTKVKFRVQGGSASTYGARMEPTRAAIERKLKARFRICVGNTSTVCKYTTAKATALKELPTKKFTNTSVVSSITNRIDKQKAQPRKAITNAFREPKCSLTNAPDIPGRLAHTLIKDAT